MRNNDFEYDPDKALWKPNRRSFFFGLGAALLAPMLPDLPVDSSGSSCVTGPLMVGDIITFKGVYRFNGKFIVTSLLGSTANVKLAKAGDLRVNV